MADENYDDMSDEDFENLLDNTDDVEAEDPVEDFEDTDPQEKEPEANENDTETNEDNDDDLDDTDDDSDDDDDDSEEENTHDLSDEDNNDDDDSEDSDEEDDSAAPDPKSMTPNGKFDYKKAYEGAVAKSAQFEDFFNQTTGDFIANGKTMSAPKDPKKIIQAFQKAAGFDDKMKAFKKYRPFITPLQEKGILDNPDKFNLMMNAMDGDSEAIKRILSNAEIDPIELDMDNINYTPTNSVSSDIELAYEDVMESATQNGVKAQVQKVISGEWDDQSVVELLNDPENSADLVSHLSTGVYDLVQERISQKKMIDSNGVFGNKKSIEQYREAAKEIEGEYLHFLQQQEQSNPTPEQQQVVDQHEEFQFSEEEIQEEIERIKAERSYASKVEKKNAEASRGRKKAASLSKKKPRTKKKNTSFDPGTLSDEEFTAYLDGMIYE